MGEASGLEARDERVEACVRDSRWSERMIPRVGAEGAQQNSGIRG